LTRDSFEREIRAPELDMRSAFMRFWCRCLAN
jgi:hypothetical protein